MLKRFDYVTRPDATRTDLDSPDGSLLNCFYFLQIWVPCPPSFVVGVTDIIAEAGAFSTDCAYLGHVLDPPT